MAPDDNTGHPNQYRLHDMASPVIIYHGPPPCIKMDSSCSRAEDPSVALRDSKVQTSPWSDVVAQATCINMSPAAAQPIDIDMSSDCITDNGHIQGLQW